MLMITMSNEDYQDIVAVALFAIEHGFEVEYVGLGDLLVKHIPREKKQNSAQCRFGRPNSPVAFEL